MSNVSKRPYKRWKRRRMRRIHQISLRNYLNGNEGYHKKDTFYVDPDSDRVRYHMDKQKSRKIRSKKRLIDRDIKMNKNKISDELVPILCDCCDFPYILGYESYV